MCRNNDSWECNVWGRGLKQMTAISDNIILPSTNHFSLCDSFMMRKSILIGALLSMSRSIKKMYRQCHFCCDQAAKRASTHHSTLRGKILWCLFVLQNSIIQQGKSVNRVISSERIEWHTIYEPCIYAQGMLWELFILFQIPPPPKKNPKQLLK